MEAYVPVFLIIPRIAKRAIQGCSWLYSAYYITNDETTAKIPLATGPHKVLTIVNRYKLLSYGNGSCSLGLAKTDRAKRTERERRQGGEIKRWEDNIREWSRREFGKSQRAVENKENGENGLPCPSSINIYIFISIYSTFSDLENFIIAR